jgi:hypothetical protein
VNHDSQPHASADPYAIQTELAIGARAEATRPGHDSLRAACLIFAAIETRDARLLRRRLPVQEQRMEALLGRRCVTTRYRSNHLRDHCISSTCVALAAVPTNC